VRGVSASGYPTSCRFFDGDEWVRAFKSLRTIPANAILVKLTVPTEPKEHKHFIYLLWWPGKCCWFVEGTNYSGGGSRTYRIMEKWLNDFRRFAETHPGHFSIVETEIPHKAWWPIFNGLYHIFKQEGNAEGSE